MHANYLKTCLVTLVALYTLCAEGRAEPEVEFRFDSETESFHFVIKNISEESLYLLTHNDVPWFYGIELWDRREGIGYKMKTAANYEADQQGAFLAQWKDIEIRKGQTRGFSIALSELRSSFFAVDQVKKLVSEKIYEEGKVTARLLISYSYKETGSGEGEIERYTTNLIPVHKEKK